MIGCTRPRLLLWPLCTEGRGVFVIISMLRHHLDLCCRFASSDSVAELEGGRVDAAWFGYQAAEEAARIFVSFIMVNQFSLGVESSSNLCSIWPSEPALPLGKMR